jgi:hypothetical protein
MKCDWGEVKVVGCKFVITVRVYRQHISSCGNVWHKKVLTCHTVMNVSWSFILLANLVTYSYAIYYKRDISRFRKGLSVTIIYIIGSTAQFRPWPLP